MKTAILTLSFLAASFVMQAQTKFAYVDIDYVLKNIPDYADAQRQLDEITVSWQKEIDSKYEEVDKLQKQFQAEQVLLTDEMKQQRQTDIISKSKAAKDLQKKRFGYQGELFQKRQELIQPIQDKVYEAIQKIATTKSYDFVFDKSSGTTVLYANPKINVSDDVLKAMGYSPKSTKTEPKQSGGK
ncbi:MAG: OmpH family outer membrane protein [Chitinophagales bacterium]|nr:OmpH family outer membrane protein [Chitinophagales bacterium]